MARKCEEKCAGKSILNRGKKKAKNTRRKCNLIGEIEKCKITRRDFR